MLTREPILLHDFANELRKDKETLAKTATTEMGKPIKEARSEVEKCTWVMEYYADNGQISQQMRLSTLMLGKQ